MDISLLNAAIESGNITILDFILAQPDVTIPKDVSKVLSGEDIPTTYLVGVIETLEGIAYSLYRRTQGRNEVTDYSRS